MARLVFDVGRYISSNQRALLTLLGVERVELHNGTVRFLLDGGRVDGHKLASVGISQLVDNELRDLLKEELWLEEA